MAELNISLRKWQADFYKQMKRFNVLVVHRRAGKTYCTLLKLILDALNCKKSNPRFAYIAPEKKQGEDNVWGYVKMFLEKCPVAEIKESANRVVLKHNNATIEILGLKNVESLRGRYFDGIVVDEYSDAPRGAFGQVLIPCLADRQGWCILMGTIKGQCLLHEAYQTAKTDETGLWYCASLTNDDTHALPETEVDLMRQMMTDEQFQVEMLNDPYANFTNMYFRELMIRAEEQKRVGQFHYNIKSPVFAGFDLGRDTTACWFAQRDGKKIVFIDYWEKANAKLPEVFNMLSGRGYVYHTIFLPHDAVRETIESEASTYRQFKSHGYKVEVIDRVPVQERISTSQTMLINCHFDSDKCHWGLITLKNYKAKVDKKLGIMLDKPVHDQFSHGADAFQYTILGLGRRKTSFDSLPPLKFDNSHDFLNQI